MKELKFFYDEIDLEGIKNRLDTYKREIVEIKNTPGYGSGFTVDDLEFTDDFTEYSYSRFTMGEEHGGVNGYVTIYRSIQADIEKAFNSWFEDSYEKGLFEFSENVQKEFVSRLRGYLNSVSNDEIMQKTLLPTLQKFIFTLSELYPTHYNQAQFQIQETSDNTLTEASIDDLIFIYNFNHLEKSICDSVTIEEWVEYFVYGKHPKKAIKFNYGTAVACQALEHLAENYSKSTKKDFYLFIEYSKCVYTNRNTLLTERNISKSADTYNDKTSAYKKSLKAHLNK